MGLAKSKKIALGKSLLYIYDHLTTVNINKPLYPYAGTPDLFYLNPIIFKTFQLIY